MYTSIILILAMSLSLEQISAQFPSYFQSNGSPRIPPSNGWQHPMVPYQQNRAFASPSLSLARQSSPQISTISQLSGYNGLSSGAPQTSAWSQPQSSGPRSWSIPTPIRSYSAPSQPQTSFSGYPRPMTLSSPVQATPSQVQGTPFQSSWSINHQSPAPSAPAVAPQSYNIAPPAQSPPTQSWSPAPAAPSTQWNPPSVQSYSAPRPAPVAQWRPPTQSYSAPQPAPVSQWTPPAQTYSAPQPQTAPQPAPVSTQSYQSPQNAQNMRPAPVHYADIGPQLQGDYKFGYHTGDGGSFREETRLPDGTVQGAYGFIDADGKQRIVRYRAGKDGFQAEGDDVPKGSAPAQAAPSPSQPSQPINIDEGAAFKSFSQG